MARHSNPIPDRPPGKGISHYVNGKDRTDGMHDGIRSQCGQCSIIDPNECQWSVNGKHFYNLDLIEVNGNVTLALVCIWCGAHETEKGK
jgi:hypothetical protein